MAWRNNIGNSVAEYPCELLEFNEVRTIYI